MRIKEKVLTLGSDKLRMHVVTGRVAKKRVYNFQIERENWISYTQKKVKNGKKRIK